MLTPTVVNDLLLVNSDVHNYPACPYSATEVTSAKECIRYHGLSIGIKYLDQNCYFMLIRHFQTQFNSIKTKALSPQMTSCIIWIKECKVDKIKLKKTRSCHSTTHPANSCSIMVHCSLCTLHTAIQIIISNVQIFFAWAKYTLPGSVFLLSLHLIFYEFVDALLLMTY